MSYAKQVVPVGVKVLSERVYRGITVFRRGKEIVINAFLECEKCGYRSEGVLFQGIGYSFENPPDFCREDIQVCRTCKTQYFTKIDQNPIYWWWEEANVDIRDCLREDVKMKKANIPGIPIYNEGIRRLIRKTRYQKPQIVESYFLQKRTAFHSRTI